MVQAVAHDGSSRLKRPSVCSPVLPVNGLLENKTKSPCGRGSIVVLCTKRDCRLVVLSDRRCSRCSCSGMERRHNLCFFQFASERRVFFAVVYLVSSVEARMMSPCSCSRRRSKLTWCTTVVFGHGESLQSFVVDLMNHQSSGCDCSSVSRPELTWGLQEPQVVSVVPIEPC